MVNKIILILSMLFTFFLLVWGLTGDTPFACEGDEMYCVAPALEMLRRSELNPHWLAHPASTTIYPLYCYYQFLNAQMFHGILADPSMVTENLVFDNVYMLCYLPRFVNVIFVVACLPLLYLIGRSVFGKGAALMALPLFTISPLLLRYVQVIRSEAPALFFSMIAIYLSLRLYKRPTIALHILIGLAIGLAVSSRYPMIALVSLFIVIDAIHAAHVSTVRMRLKHLSFGAIAYLTVILVFAVTTPFFFLDFGTFLHDMAVEKAAHGLGCDGFSSLGNLRFYILEAIPYSFFPAQSLLAVAGMLIALARRKLDAAILILYSFAIVLGTCLHPFHSDRWLIPVLPMLALFAGYALALLMATLKSLAARFMIPRDLVRLASIPLALLIVFHLEYQPFLDCCAQNAAKVAIGTSPIFYQWIFSHVPPGSKICVVGGVWEGGHRERFGTKDFLYDPSYFDKECGGKYVSPFDLYRQGFKYFICSDAYYPMYRMEPLHYPRENRFFTEFFSNCSLIKEVAPRQLNVAGLRVIPQRGATFRFYEWKPKKY